MKNRFIFSMFIGMLVVGCQSATKMPGEISLAPGPKQVTAPPLADVTELKNPWAKFGKGSWVHYKIFNPTDEKEYQQKYTVVKTTREKATIEISQLENDKWEKKTIQEVSLQPALVPKSQGTPDTLTVAGKKVNCTWLEKTNQMKEMATTKEWTSDKVPGGTVRKEMAGKCVMEVVDFGVVK